MKTATLENLFFGHLIGGAPAILRNAGNRFQNVVNLILTTVPAVVLVSLVAPAPPIPCWIILAFEDA